MAEQILRSLRYPGTIFEDRANGLYLESFAYEPGFFRFNWHQSLELLVVLRGGLTAYVEGSAFLMEEDDVLLINTNAGHATLSARQDTVLLLLHVDPAVFEPLFPRGRIPCFTCRSTPADRHMPAMAALRRTMAELYHQLWEAEMPVAAMGARGSLLTLCAQLLQEFPWQLVERSGRKGSAEKVRQIIRYVDEHYAQRIRLEDVAQHMGMNRTYLSTFFKEQIGINFYDYLTRKRLTQAGLLLNNSDESVLTIALASGFSDVKSFNAAFRKFYDLSPDRYRRQLGEDFPQRARDMFPILLPPEHQVVAGKLAAYRAGARNGGL